MKSLVGILFLIDQSSGIKSAASLESAFTRYFRSKEMAVTITGTSSASRLVNVSPDPKEVSPRLVEFLFCTDTQNYTNTSQFLHEIGQLFSGAGIIAKQISTNLKTVVIWLSRSAWDTVEPVKVEEPQQLSTRFLHRLMEKEDKEEYDKADARDKDRLMKKRYEKMLKSLQSDLHLPRAL